MQGLVVCDKVKVMLSPIEGAGAGAFAAVAIPKGELVEAGIVRRLTAVDGNINPYVFTWSDDVPNTTWAVGSGCSTFYNTAPGDACNVKMLRFFADDRFEIYATRDIAAGEELLHEYKSKAWRTCFQPLATPTPAEGAAASPAA